MVKHRMTGDPDPQNIADNFGQTAYNPIVDSAALEQALRDFDRVATLLRDEKDRQVWQFDFSGRPYLFYFYPRSKGILRPARVGPALMEFLRLQAMQRAEVASPRAVAQMSGFRIRGVLGDVLITELIPNLIPLDQYLEQRWLDGTPVLQHRSIVEQIAQIVTGIGSAKFGHRSLTLDRFSIDPTNRKVYLQDVRGLRRGGLLVDHLLVLAHDASRFASRADLLRGWNGINPDFYPPRKNRLSPKLWRRFISRARQVNEDFGRIQSGDWSGFFPRRPLRPVPWASASELTISNADWETAWPKLLVQIQAGELPQIKADPSGEVWSGEITLAGKAIPIIIKHPRRKYWYRYLIDLFRPARAERMWIKAWTLISRNLPCEYPMLLIQQKTLGYATDGYIVFQRVPGERLDQINLDSLQPARREMLFRRAGRILRSLEQTGLVHYDSKSTNWIVYQDDAHGAIPVMIDVDGIRSLNYWLQLWGIHRLLRAMKQHPQYTPSDSLAICLGFAPYTPIQMEEPQPAGGK